MMVIIVLSEYKYCVQWSDHCSLCMFRCAVISRPVSNAAVDCVALVRPAAPAANVNNSVSTCASHATHPTSCHAAAVCQNDTKTKQTCAMSVKQQGVNADDIEHESDLSTAKSLLAVAVNQRQVTPSRSTDRLTSATQYTRPSTHHGTSVQRSRSFTTTTTEQPTANIGTLYVSFNTP